MVNTNLLRARMVERGMTVSDLSEAIGISTSAFYRKLNNASTFTVGEAEKIVEVLHLSEADAIAIFFSSLVA